MIYPTVARLRQYVRDELQQRLEEGCQVDGFSEVVADPGLDSPRLLEVYQRLCQLEPRPDFPFSEPSALDRIRAARPAARPQPAPPPEIDEQIADRISGGWLGRCAGLMLGKPFECSPFGEDWRALRKYLEVAGAYPLADYPPGDPAACRAVGRQSLSCPDCHRGKVSCVVADDDIHYTIAGLEVLEQKGVGFTTADVARWWMRNLTPTSVFTAEEAVFRNLLQLGLHFEPHKATAAEWEHVRGWLNPWREWIGAQIRADGWAFACPGDPELAAEFAWRDASLSHVKNGIYGEMFCASMISAAAVSDDPLEIVSVGLGQIPEQSRLADAVRRTVACCRELGFSPERYEDAIEWLWSEFGRYHVVHTINNATAVVAGLLLGGHDYEKVICTAVMCGWDTDCNGATAGSICGTMLGAKRLPAKWIAPLRDTLRVDVPGYHPAAISDCVRRQVEVARRVRAQGAATSRG